MQSEWVVSFSKRMFVIAQKLVVLVLVLVMVVVVVVVVVEIVAVSSCVIGPRECSYGCLRLRVPAAAAAAAACDCMHAAVLLLPLRLLAIVCMHAAVLLLPLRLLAIACMLLPYTRKLLSLDLCFPPEGAKPCFSYLCASTIASL